MKNKSQKLNSNNVTSVKQWVKNSLQFLPDYTEGEEKFLIYDSTNLNSTKLLVLKEFDKKQIKKIKGFVNERLKGKPLNKISKKTYFYEEEFIVNNFVLSPRKETEILVELVLEELKNSKILASQVLDLCCGSGAIGLTVAKHNKNCFVTLSDISSKAIKVSQKNQKNLNTQQNTKIIKSNLFEGLKKNERFDIIVSNPPYIATDELSSLQHGVKTYEPALALDGGQDGLKFYKIIANKASDYLNKNGKIYVEIGYNQKEEVCNLFKQNGYKTKCIKDYSGLDRIIVAYF